MSELFCLDARYSTTSLVTREKSLIENSLDSKIRSVLFLPPYPARQGEGGLRTKGYFKRSLPDKPLISVITVVFNGEKRLEETIQSVLNQTYDNLEYIIIDGGSSDETISVIKKYEEQIDYWVSEPDSGVYDAMNKGLNLISSCWVNFMNCGDMFVDSSAIINCIPYLTANDLILYSDTVFYKSINNTIYYKIFNCDHSRLNIVHQSCLYNIKLHNDYGRFISNRSITNSDYIFFNLIPNIKWHKAAHNIAMYLVDDNISIGYRHILQKLCVDILMKNNTYYKCVASAIVNSLRYTLSIILPSHYYTTKIAKYKLTI